MRETEAETVLIDTALLFYQRHLLWTSEKFEHRHGTKGKTVINSHDAFHDETIKSQLRAITGILRRRNQAGDIDIQETHWDRPETLQAADLSKIGEEDREPYLDPINGRWIYPETPFTPGPSHSTGEVTNRALQLQDAVEDAGHDTSPALRPHTRADTAGTVKRKPVKGLQHAAKAVASPAEIPSGYQRNGLSPSSEGTDSTSHFRARDHAKYHSSLPVQAEASHSAEWPTSNDVDDLRSCIPDVLRIARPSLKPEHSRDGSDSWMFVPYSVQQAGASGNTSYLIGQDRRPVQHPGFSDMPLMNLPQGGTPVSTLSHHSHESLVNIPTPTHRDPSPVHALAGSQFTGRTPRVVHPVQDSVQIHMPDHLDFMSATTSARVSDYAHNPAQARQPNLPNFSRNHATPAHTSLDSTHREGQVPMESAWAQHSPVHHDTSTTKSEYTMSNGEGYDVVGELRSVSQAQPTPRLRKSTKNMFQFAPSPFQSVRPENLHPSLPLDGISPSPNTLLARNDAGVQPVAMSNTAYPNQLNPTEVQRTVRPDENVSFNPSEVLKPSKSSNLALFRARALLNSPVSQNYSNQDNLSTARTLQERFNREDQVRLSADEKLARELQEEEYRTSRPLTQHLEARYRKSAVFANQQQGLRAANVLGSASSSSRAAAAPSQPRFAPLHEIPRIVSVSKKQDSSDAPLDQRKSSSQGFDAAKAAAEEIRRFEAQIRDQEQKAKRSEIDKDKAQRGSGNAQLECIACGERGEVVDRAELPCNHIYCTDCVDNPFNTHSKAASYSSVATGLLPSRTSQPSCAPTSSRFTPPKPLSFLSQTQFTAHPQCAANSSHLQGISRARWPSAQLVSL